MCIIRSALIFVLTLWLPSGVVSSNYNEVDLFQICPRDGSKKEVRLGDRPAIFHLNADLFPGNFYCHLELEVGKGFGIHVYMDEMHLLGDEQVDNCPDDYIQFKRDVLAFTTHHSPKFCGNRPRITYNDTQTGMPAKPGGIQRMYLEELDFEMDFLIQLSRAPRATRNLSVVVTPFRKGCRRSDQTYQQCDHTSSYCIKKELFCDGFPNCGWPSGEDPSDEMDCAEKPSPGFFRLSNIPIIIVIFLAIGFVFVLVLLVICHLAKPTAKPEEFGSLVRPSNPARNQTPPLLGRGGDFGAPSAPTFSTSMRDRERRPTAPRFQSSASERERLPSAPPPYDEVAGLAPPPPYSEH